MSHEHGRDSTATGCREPVPSSRISSGRPPVLPWCSIRAGGARGEPDQREKRPFLRAGDRPPTAAGWGWGVGDRRP